MRVVLNPGAESESLDIQVLVDSIPCPDPHRQARRLPRLLQQPLAGIPRRHFGQGRRLELDCLHSSRRRRRHCGRMAILLGERKNIRIRNARPHGRTVITTGCSTARCRCATPAATSSSGTAPAWTLRNAKLRKDRLAATRSSCKAASSIWPKRRRVSPHRQLGNAGPTAASHYWSAAVISMHGLEPSGKPPSVEKYLDCDSSPGSPVRGGLDPRKAGEASRQNDFEVKRIVRPDGESATFAVSALRLTENRGTWRDTWDSAIDITEHELAQAQELRPSAKPTYRGPTTQSYR